MSSTSPIVYRPATRHDIEALTDMRAEFLAEVAHAAPNDPDLRDALRRYFSETVPAGNFIAFLAEVNGRVIATSGLVYHRYPPSARNLQGVEGYIMNMFTRPEWRGRGIASRLLNELIAIARQANCGRIRLNAIPEAAPIYARANFVATNNHMQLDLV